MSENSPLSSNNPEILRDKRVAAALFVLLAAAILLPIWIVHYPSLLDFPNHVASAFVLGHLHDPSYTFGQYYAGQWGLKPYIATDFMMMELAKIVPPLVAGKIVLSLGALGLPLAACFFLRQVHPGEDALAFWFLLAAHNIFFRYGFIGYFCSLGLMFLMLGLWLRWLKKPSILRWSFACLALTATYFSHIFGFIFAMLIVGLYSLTRPRWREWLWSAALAIPGIVFYFISSRVVEKQYGEMEFRTVLDKLAVLNAILHGNSIPLDVLSFLSLAALLLIGLWRNREFKWDWRWLVVLAGLWAAFAAMPVGYGDGWNVDIRALPVIFIVLFTMARFGKRAWKLAPLALLIFAARTFEVSQHFRAAQPELEGLARSFSMTPPNARVLPIVEGSWEEPMDTYFAHFWAYGVVDRGWFSPYLFQVPGLLPLQIAKDTYTLDGFWDLSYDERVEWTGIQDDYDYVWGYDVPDRFQPGLHSIGEVIYTSGKLQLFRIDKKKTAAPPLPALPPDTDQH
ncbi:MAG: hypothetical protein WB997_02800 [Candidatus Acidiferrales bacterium]